MHSNDTDKKDNTLTIRMVCLVLFLLFCLGWLYFFQADMLSVAQHWLSGGKTHYDRNVGTLIITTVLVVVQLLVYVITRLSRRPHALTYLPSFLLLAFVSSVSFPFRWGHWLWAGPLVLVLWVGVVIVARKVPTFAAEQKGALGLLSRCMWINVLQMAAMMLMVASVGNTQAVAHYKARAEVALMQGDADEALRVGHRSLESDASLTMLRAFALAQKGQLGERLFEYPISGTGADLLPLRGSNSHLLVMPDTLLWQLFGIGPDSIAIRNDSALRVALMADTTRRVYLDVNPYAKRLSTSQYIDTLEHLACVVNDSAVTHAYRDYRLMASLINRQLDAFTHQLPRYYTVNDSLPRHYREALVLYRHLNADTLLYNYSDSMMMHRFEQFHQMDSVYPRKSERRLRTEDDFHDTYWYYYYN
ncbi:MAG: hypothetical protein IKI19_07720 [Prevotella sp.]|nr:hypothetical protein [Prevotella sp.]